jgi:LacI family transcriptional regulator, gluconate utilization system Gnt-I transcriptional repressor
MSQFMPTMADVAREAGVSKMTVSRVLAGRDVSAAMREHVLAVIKQLGYVPDASAGTLSSGRSPFIVALVPSMSSSNFADTVHSLNSVVNAHGLQLLLGDTDYDPKQEEQLLRVMLAHRPEGVMLTGSYHTAATREMLGRSKVPVVETWDVPRNPIQQAVGFSNVDAACEMMRHLHERGYRRIGFIGGATKLDRRGLDRQKGYREGLRRYGLGDARVIEHGGSPITLSHGGEAFARLIDTWPDTDAVMCVSDMSAFGALMECHRRGIEVPKQMAVAGFGDFEVSRHCYPTISTVSVDPHAIGRIAGEMLLAAKMAKTSGAGELAGKRRVEFRVVAREST